MDHSNLKGSDRCALLAVLDPDANGAGAVSSAWISMADYGRVMAVVAAGDLGTNATLDFKVQQATDASGTGVKDVTGAAITQLTQAGTDESNKQAIIDVHRSALDIANDFDHVRITMTTGTATSDSAAFLWGFDLRNNPLDGTQHAATVAEVVSV